MLKNSFQTEHTITKIGNEGYKIISWIRPSVYMSAYQTGDSLEPGMLFLIFKKIMWMHCWNGILRK